MTLDPWLLLPQIRRTHVWIIITIPCTEKYFHRTKTLCTTHNGDKQTQARQERSFSAQAVAKKCFDRCQSYRWWCRWLVMVVSVLLSSHFDKQLFLLGSQKLLWISVFSTRRARWRTRKFKLLRCCTYIQNRINYLPYTRTLPNHFMSLITEHLSHW